MAHTPQNIVDIRVLIIDDNKDFANVFAKLLKIRGFSVTVETTFKIGLRHLKHEICDIVFVDVPLDGYDEKQILYSLKENKMFEKLKVFLFSSIDLDKTELDEWQKCGLHMYLKKPVKRDVIIKALDDVRAKLNVITSQTINDSIVDSNEATPEQLSRLNELQKQIERLESRPESTTEPETDSSHRDSPPKDSAREIPQEPDPEPESDEATPEQLSRLNELQKQIERLESRPESTTEPETDSSHRDSPPKDSAREIPQEPDPEPESDEATPEQLSRLNELQKQIERLESRPESTTEPETDSSHRDSPPKDSAREIPQEPDPEPESSHTVDYSVLKKIVSNLRLQSTLKPAEHNPTKFHIENNHKDKEAIKKEIEKIQLEMSALKNKIILFNSTEPQDSQSIQRSSTDKKNKIKKKPSGTKAKNKIKKKPSGTKAKNKIKKKPSGTKAKNRR